MMAYIAHHTSKEEGMLATALIGRGQDDCGLSNTRRARMPVFFMQNA
jgi:hypothetical protein